MNGAMLVFGAGGQVGRELISLAGQRGVPAMGLKRADADLTDADALRTVIRMYPPAIVINAAGYTAVDRAESEPEVAHAVNAEGAANLAAACASARVPIVHISTDYVFGGEKTGAYVEDDPIEPLSVYGRTKADGEARVRALQPRHVILRTSWVYGAYGQNFLRTILRLAAERDELRIVADQFGCPTATADIAEAILALAPRLVADASVAGTYHFAGSGSTSWHGFASEIVARQRPFTRRNPRVIAIATADYPTLARRPMNSVLNCRRFHAIFGYVARPWAERVGEIMEALLAAGQPAFR